MYSRILVPLDGSKLAEGILPYAALLSRTFGIRIDLLRAVAPPAPISDGSYGELTKLPHGPAPDQVKEQASRYIADVERNLQSSGLQASSSVQVGAPADVIAEQAALEANTLVAMSTHGRTGVARWAMGSITDKVINIADQPMLVVRPDQSKPLPEEIRFETLILPLDGSTESEQSMAHALPLAKALNLKVVLVTVNPGPSDYYLVADYPAGGVFYDSAEDVARADKDAGSYVEAVAERIRGEGIRAVETRVARGDAGSAIVDLATEIQNSLVSMATHGRSGVGRWVMGSVSSKVIRHSGDPVLLTRTRA